MEEKQFSQIDITTMKLLHYFITEEDYNPIILQGVDNEIWLENLGKDYKIVRIVSNYIHNEEQMEFDLFKTKRIVRKIKAKTFSLKMNVLSIFLDLGESVELEDQPGIACASIEDTADLEKYPSIMEYYPNLLSKLTYNEEGLQLFLKITADINHKNQTEAEHTQDIFEPKKPVMTYCLIAINILCFLLPTFLGVYDQVLDMFCVHGPSIRYYHEYYRIITGAFLHANMFHLFVNCYALYVIGSQVENYMGKAKYVGIYLFAAISGSLLSITFGNYASVGASGAIFGLMGALLYFGYHYRVYLGNVLKSQIIPLIVVNLLFGFMVSGIDNFAHIGGLIGGCLSTIAVGVKYKSTKFEVINGIIVSLLFLGFLLYMGIVFAR